MPKEAGNPAAFPSAGVPRTRPGREMERRGARRRCAWSDRRRRISGRQEEDRHARRYVLLCVGTVDQCRDERRGSAVCRELSGRLPGPADLTMAFFSSHHAEAADEIGPLWRTRCAVGTCWARRAKRSWEARERSRTDRAGGMDRAHARRRTGAVSSRLSAGRRGHVRWLAQELGADWPAGSALLLMADPFTFPADVLLERLGEDQPGKPVLGGMASGATRPGENRLLLGPTVHRAGAVALRLSGGVRVRSVVSQGCRPIGKPMVITKAQQNVVLELGGRPALEQLRELYETLPDQERRLLETGLQLGRVINEYQSDFTRGDFLIRNVLGWDSEAGAIAIGDFCRVGQTVQFHVRDAGAADDDLRELLATAKSDGAAAAGRLLFTCNGRGTRLFSQPDHDAGSIHDALGEIPLAGFFAHGEIGPIGGQNFLHGFTAALALFEPI